jgi:oligopeptide transport system permease protein
MGRSVLIRALAGGGISLTIGLAAAAVSVGLGTLYGAVAGYAGGRLDALMMRAVDVLFGLPYVLLVVLLAIAGDAVVGEYVSRQRERAAWVQEQEAAHPDIPHGTLAARALEQLPPRDLSENARRALDLATLLVAIGGVSWLTLARVIRGQVLSLRNPSSRPPGRWAPHPPGSSSSTFSPTSPAPSSSTPLSPSRRRSSRKVSSVSWASA